MSMKARDLIETVIMGFSAFLVLFGFGSMIIWALVTMAGNCAD